MTQNITKEQEEHLWGMPMDELNKVIGIYEPSPADSGQGLYANVAKAIKNSREEKEALEAYIAAAPTNEKAQNKSI